ncbi:MAG: DUF3306 domain-containing protein [Caldimonas sp.]
MSDESGFLSRWSRRKAGLGETPASADAASAPADATSAPRRAEVLPDQPIAAPAAAPVSLAEPAPLPTLADVAALTRQSDYARFVAPGVAPGVKNAALKKLFSDPHFNIMDGLDTYIDDYGKADPIPLAMLRTMYQSASLGLFADEPQHVDPLPTADAAGLLVPNAAPEPAPGRLAACPDGDAGAAVAQFGPSAPAFPPTAAPERAASCESDDHADLRLQQDDATRRSGPGPGPRA